VELVICDGRSEAEKNENAERQHANVTSEAR